MIDEQLIEIVGIGEPIVVINRAEAQIVKRWHVIGCPGNDIETGKIKFRQLVVEEELLHDPEFQVEVIRNARPVRKSDPGCDKDIIPFATADERSVRGPVKRRVNRNCERLIFRRAFQDLLLADVLLIWTRDGITLSFGAGRSRWPR